MVSISDEWAAFQFDNAVVLVGLGIENALQELVKEGEGADAKWKPKYTLHQLLADDFRLPVERDQPSDRPSPADIQLLKKLAKQAI